MVSDIRFENCERKPVHSLVGWCTKYELNLYSKCNVLKCGKITKTYLLAQLNLFEKIVAIPPSLLFCLIE